MELPMMPGGDDLFILTRQGVMPLDLVREQAESSIEQNHAQADQQRAQADAQLAQAASTREEPAKDQKPEPAKEAA